jgi:DNA-binding transcriptional LysR family regulator
MPTFGNYCPCIRTMKPTDLNAVAVFAKVVDLKSFRAAALALGAPPSTVSARVAQLEGQLGVRLLERTTRTLHLTHAGAAYYRSITAPLEALHAAQQTVDDLKMDPSGPLRVTTTVDGGQFVLAPILVEYMRRYPKVELDVELTDRRVDLIEEGFDLALRMGDLPDSSLVARKLGTPGRLCVYASPDYVKHHGEPLRPQLLEKHDCLIMNSQAEPATWTFQVKRKAVRISVRPRASANSFVLLRELAVAGMGIVRLPDFIAAPAVAAGQLQPLLQPYVPAASTWQIVFPSARYLSPKLRALVELLEQHFGPAPRA